MGWRLTTSNWTRCMWNTCEIAAEPSGEKFHTCHSSVDPCLGCSVIGSSQLSGLGGPLEFTVPHAYCEITLSWKLDPVSLSDTCLLLVCRFMIGGGGRCRCLGGVEV